VEKGIDRPRAKPVSVTAKFLDDAQAEDRLVRCVMQHVQANQADVKFLILSCR
jgi:hypothetical protein